jgi:2-hydroxychromene-2-carboxylate isomerase
MQATWYFDFISPFAYLQLPGILRLRERIDITPVPILFGAVLSRLGQLGPAEIPGKREFTYRFVQWSAEREGTTLRFPPAHPFNPMAALRLCIAAGTRWDSIEAIFAHLWRDGRRGDDAGSLADVARALGIADPAAAVATDAVKTALRANTDAALAAGVFGVPTLCIDSMAFWGNDATLMIEDFLADPRRFGEGEYARLAALPVGIERAR